MAKFTSETRKSHIKRIFGITKNRDTGALDENKDIWIDIIRTDVVMIKQNAGDDGILYKLKWQDNELSDGREDFDYESRKTELIKIWDPQNPPEDENDPDEYVPLRLIKSIDIFINGQGIRYHFKNKILDESGDPIPTKRKVSKRRVHNATLDSSLDERLNNKENIPDEVYDRPLDDDEDNIDKDVYVDVEIIVGYQITLNADGQDIITHSNRDIFTEAIFPLQPQVNEDGSTPRLPLRLDPYQNIVNAQFGGGTRFLGQPKDVDSATSRLIMESDTTSTDMMSISLRFRVKESVLDEWGVSIIEFGKEETILGYDEETIKRPRSSITVNSTSIQIAIRGTLDDNYSLQQAQGTNGVGAGSAKVFYELNVGSNSIEDIINVGPGACNHLLIGVKLGSTSGTFSFNVNTFESTADVNTNNRVSIVLNGINVTSSFTSPMFLNGAQTTYSVTPNRGEILPTRTGLITNLGTLNHGQFIPGPSIIWGISASSDPPSTPPNGVEGFDSYWSAGVPIANGTTSLPEWEMQVDSVGFPQWYAPDADNGHGTCEYDALQVWFDKFLTIANIRSFIKPDGKKLEPTMKAVDEIGKPDIWSEGTPKKFVKDKGLEPEDWVLHLVVDDDLESAPALNRIADL
jgi:hypothetical protein